MDPDAQPTKGDRVKRGPISDEPRQRDIIINTVPKEYQPVLKNLCDERRWDKIQLSQVARIYRSNRVDLQHGILNGTITPWDAAKRLRDEGEFETVTALNCYCDHADAEHKSAEKTKRNAPFCQICQAYCARVGSD